MKAKISMKTKSFNDLAKRSALSAGWRPNDVEYLFMTSQGTWLWFYAYKKYKNGNSARRTYLQRHIWPPITQNGSDIFGSGISGKLPKIATSNANFLRTADRVAAKFCNTIQKIKPIDIFQKCVHSTSTLKIYHLFPLPLHSGNIVLEAVLMTKEWSKDLVSIRLSLTSTQW